MMAMKHTNEGEVGPDQRTHEVFQYQRCYIHAKVLSSCQCLKWEAQANGRKINKTFRSEESGVNAK